MAVGNALRVDALLASDPAVNHKKLFNPESGRLDASRIADAMGVPVTRIADALTRKPAGVRKSPDAESLQEGLRPIYFVWTSLVDFYAGDAGNARIFLNAPNRYLENKAPITFIGTGDMAPLEMFVDAINARQPF